MTFALGWCLEHSRSFLNHIVRRFDLPAPGAQEVTVHLPRSGEDRGFIDVELFAENAFHVILEAKKGWELPTADQLERYTSRFAPQRGSRQLLVSVSAARGHKQYRSALTAHPATGRTEGSQMKIGLRQAPSLLWCSASEERRPPSRARQAAVNRGWEVIETVRAGGRVGLGRVEAIDNATRLVRFEIASLSAERQALSTCGKRLNVVHAPR